MSLPLPEELTRAQQLHDCAMDSAENAILCQIKGDHNGFLSATQNALHCEMQAAGIIQPYLDYEPSRSVMLRSAAALALDLKEWRTAERLVCTALAGNPPDSIAEELRDLLEQTKVDHQWQRRSHAASEIDSATTLRPINGTSARSSSPSIVGYLRTANKIGRNTIRLEADDKRIYTVKVPTGMMNDIVRPLWDQRVMVTGHIKGTTVEMEDISLATD
jgi:hypothetical protein